MTQDAACGLEDGNGSVEGDCKYVSAAKEAILSRWSTDWVITYYRAVWKLSLDALVSRASSPLFSQRLSLSDFVIIQLSRVSAPTLLNLIL